MNAIETVREYLVEHNTASSLELSYVLVDQCGLPMAACVAIIDAWFDDGSLSLADNGEICLPPVE